MNKVQVIFLICALPLVVLACGRSSDDERSFWRTNRAPLAAGGLAIIAALFAIQAAPLVAFGLSAGGFEAFGWKALPFGLSGIYQPVIAAWLLVSMLAFAAIWREPLFETIATLAAVVAGAALGLLALKLRYHPKDVLVVMNPIEQLLDFAVTQQARCYGLLNSGLFCSLIDGISGVIARRTFILHTSARPTIFLEWLVIAGAAIAWRRGELKLAAVVTLMLLVVLGVDTLGTLRGLKVEYFLYTDPLVIVAAALLLSALVDLQRHRWVFPIGFAFFFVHIVLSQAESAKHTFMRRQPLVFCEPYFHYTKRLEGYSYCPAARQGTSPQPAK